MDGGECFQIIIEEDENGNRTTSSVIAIKDLRSEDSKKLVSTLKFFMQIFLFLVSF